MPPPDTDLQATVLATLARLGVASAAQLQQLTGRSQPTLSRVLRALSSQVVVLGRQRSARYALGQPMLGLAAQQPLQWTDGAGHTQPWGLLTHLSGNRVHVQAPGVDVLSTGRLPWFLAPLQLQGFLGRVWARSPDAAGFDANPERWTLEQLLWLLLRRVHDLPGAIGLGAQAAAAAAPLPAMPVLPSDPAARAAQLDAWARDAASTLPAGSSAGGEQAKFLAEAEEPAGTGRSHWLVKFSPPHGTPFGDRWADLLRAEALALATLADHGVPVAATELVRADARTHLLSRRFDRVGAWGRLHVVPLDAVHESFVPGGRVDWAHTIEALERQRRVPAGSAAQARALLQFGRLIGNSDMHFGNLSLCVAGPREVALGRFAGLAPVYDMLPMRWRPDPSSGVLDALPFTPQPSDLASAARPVAARFWQQVADDGGFSRGFRSLAGEMVRRLSASD